MEKKNSSRFWIGFFLGGFLGAVLIVLLGTEEGKRFAKKIRKSIDDYVDDVEEDIDKGKTTVTRKVQDLKDEALEKAGEIKDLLIGKAEEKLEKLKPPKKRIGEIQEKGREIANKIGRNLFSKQGKS